MMNPDLFLINRDAVKNTKGVWIDAFRMKLCSDCGFGGDYRFNGNDQIIDPIEEQHAVAMIQAGIIQSPREA